MKDTIHIHHSVTPQDWGKDQTVNNINAAHKARGFARARNGLYIGYHYLIGNNWTFQARQDDELGQHAGPAWNARSIGVCFVGNFNNDYMTGYQRTIGGSLVSDLMKKYGIKQYKLHRETKQTACPGAHIDRALMDKLISEFNQPIMAMNKFAISEMYHNYALRSATNDDLTYWGGQSDERIQKDLKHDLCKQTGGDGKPSFRFDEINRWSKALRQIPASIPEQNEFELRQFTAEAIVDYLINHK